MKIYEQLLIFLCCMELIVKTECPWVWSWSLSFDDLLLLLFLGVEFVL